MDTTPISSKETKSKRTNNSGKIKPKQSKSRNGCITCKSKRLKCDETKPTCQQCQKRNVSCGGYKKDFKWRPFEETTLTNKPKKREEKPTESPSDASSVEDFPLPSPTYPPPPPPPPPYTTQTFPTSPIFSTSPLYTPNDFDSFMHPPMLFDFNSFEPPFLPTTTNLDPFQPEPVEDIEEVIREPTWMSTLFRQPDVQAGSPEMLMLRFDKQTCGILSVKDGPTENPWRTLIWPLARDSPALYHAIASMTAFHTSKEKPALRVDGMEHMRSSIRSLATGIDKMRTDTALATTLVLAFSESWDQHISTGIEHLRGAKILVTQALIKHNKRNLIGDDLARLKFLCNTWVYMDVISRLTSIDDDQFTEFEDILAPLQFGADTEVDPLMGCASTLFPLIGRAAMLCRRVCRTESNSIAVISQANQIKESIEKWKPRSLFESPEDPTSDIQHALQTAEAYRYATLLYLHQAVPEIPSMTSAQLAKKVLVYLATVPLSSRLVIVQIYPLLAAGCEAWEKEDREWVCERWQSMVQRMWIGNIDRCWEVVQEVWNRRDFAADGGGSSKRRGSRVADSSITEELDPELTVRGRLHWVGVMKDWEWEILLG